MSLFARPEYVSETQAFIQQLKADKPTLGSRATQWPWLAVGQNH
jgi:hypothetical protein